MPRCAGCRRNQLVCEWPATSLAAQRGDGRSGSVHPLLQGSLAGVDFQLPYVSVPPPLPWIHTESDRPCTMTPQSVILLEHYLQETAASFAMTSSDEHNPFVTMLIPLSHADDLLMHALLAVSGAHLSYREAEQAELATATQMHYDRLLRGLRRELTDLGGSGDVRRAERLLRVSIMACHYEVRDTTLPLRMHPLKIHQAVSGDTQGTIFHHLRASRHLIQSLLEQLSTDSGEHAVDRAALGFCMEVYLYMISCNTFTPYKSSPIDRSIPLDSFLTSGGLLASFPTFGVVLAGCHELHQLIPKISILFARKLEEESGEGPIQPSESLCAMHKAIVGRLNAWHMPILPPEKDIVGDRDLRQHAASALLHALHIFLAGAFAGSAPLEAGVRAEMERHMRSTFAATMALGAARRYIATIIWPLVMAGSCILTDSGQTALLRSMRGGWFQMRQLETMSRVLTLLWEDPDPRAFGPYGLYLTMEKHGLSVSNV